jgi:pimeloyl-[acyl-carrier protein] synthase
MTTEMSPGEEFLVAALSPDFQTDPYPLFERMRAYGPVIETVAHEWFVFGHEHAATALRHPAFSSDERRGRNFQMNSEAKPRMVEQGERPVLLFMDAPDHTRLRRLVMHAFTPSVVSRMRATATRLATKHLDAIDPTSPVDIVEAFTHPIPVEIICELLGVPTADIPLFKDWSTVLSRSVDPGFLRSPELEASIDATGLLLNEYIESLSAERRRNPKDDLLSALLQVEDSGDRISRDELIELMQLLLIAGHETTVNLIGNALLALARHPDQRQILINDPSRIDTSIDEFMRYDSPVQLSQRIATEGIDLCGQNLEAGDQVVLLLGAANRDPAAFEHAHAFDLQRDARRQVGFGGGIHHCLGMSLARMESSVALGEFLQRFPNFELADEPERRPNFTLRGVSKMMLSLR